jgi:hypothetical protein
MTLFDFSRRETLTRREVVIAAILLAVVIILTDLPAFSGHAIVLAADGPRQEYPMQHYAWSMLVRGELPTWANNIGGGLPMLAGPHAAMFYPPNWFLAWHARRLLTTS